MRLIVSFWPCFLLVLSYWSIRIGAAPTDVPSAASFYVSSLPDLPSDPSKPLHIYAGHLPSDPSIKSASPTDIIPHIFFFMIKARRLADKERIIFWFNGGPGCSSFDGLMLESGPLRTDGKGGLKLIDDGWDEYTTIVFVDQPVGTGLSYTSTDHYVHNLDEAASQIVHFLHNFYDVFPEYQNMETYLAGESYAGQYIPYFAEAILSSNLAMPLKGLAIGNGWIDGRSQYPGYVEYAVRQGILVEGSEDYKEAKTMLDNCLKMINETKGPQSPSVNYCEGITNAVMKGLNRDIAGKKVCMNVYDVRLSDTYPACGANWPPELPDIAQYLRRPDVLRALHATDKSEGWVECNSRVGAELHNTRTPASITLLPSLLGKLNILLFSGDQDFICNYVGTENLISNMHWNEETGLGDAETLPWIVDGIDAGTWVTSRNLTYVKVYNSSHMVPYDMPQIAHDMMLRFMGLDFAQLASGSAKVPSKVGNDTKPSLNPTTVDQDTVDSTITPATGGKTPEQDKAMWEAYYNAGSAALTLVLIALVIGLFFFCRQRRRRLYGIVIPREDPEEAIPLSRRAETNGYHDIDRESRNHKGKEREDSSNTVFEVGGSDEEEDFRDSKHS